VTAELIEVIAEMSEVTAELNAVTAEIKKCPGRESTVPCFATILFI